MIGRTITTNMRRRLDGIHRQIAKTSLQLRRRKVWCLRCGFWRRIDTAACLQFGWPQHCGETMSIQSPEEVLQATSGGAR